MARKRACAPRRYAPRRGVLTTALGTNGPRRALRLAGVTADERKAVPPSQVSSRPQAKPESRDPLAPLAGMRREAFTPSHLSYLRRQVSRFRRGGWVFAPASLLVIPDEAARPKIRNRRATASGVRPGVLWRGPRLPDPGSALRAVREDEGGGCARMALRAGGRRRGLRAGWRAKRACAPRRYAPRRGVLAAALGTNRPRLALRLAGMTKEGPVRKAEPTHRREPHTQDVIPVSAQPKTGNQ